MILKDADDKTIDLANLTALRDRAGLTPRQQDAIRRQIEAIRTGDRGERDVAYFLDHGLRNSADTLVIHDLRLELEGQVAQIDHLVISRYRLAYVLETKTLNASLKCNEAGEWTAWYGAYKRGTPVPIPSPIEQARRHVDVLARWFQTHHLTTIKRIEPVVIVSPTTFVGKTRARGDAAVAIVRSDLFARWWEYDRNIGHALSTPWLFATRYSTEQLADLGAKLVADHRPISRDWEAQFSLMSTLGGQSRGVSRVDPTTRSRAPVALAAVSVAVDERSHSTNASFDGRELVTAFGVIYLKRVTDGRYAIRHENAERLAEHVGRVGRRHGTWQPRFRNWLIPPDSIAIVAAELVGLSA